MRNRNFYCNFIKSEMLFYFHWQRKSRGFAVQHSVSKISAPPEAKRSPNWWPNHDRHCRWFDRQQSVRTRLYLEYGFIEFFSFQTALINITSKYLLGWSKAHEISLFVTVSVGQLKFSFDQKAVNLVVDSHKNDFVFLSRFPTSGFYLLPNTKKNSTQLSIRYAWSENWISFDTRSHGK